MTDVTLDKVINVRGRFHRSVQLARDWEEQRGIDEYLLTPKAQEITYQILVGADSQEGPRAWSITGPYGTGKSAFALFLTDLLANQPPKHDEAQVLRRELDFQARPFVPILVIGQRTSLVPEFLRALGNSLERIDGSLGQRIIEAARKEKMADREVVDLFEQAAQLVQDKGYEGLLLIVDEFGKFLEYAARHPESEDLFILQGLAEATVRSEAPIILLTILHSAFAEYLSVLDEARRAEWQKVQGRFADLAFLEPPEQFLRLVGEAIEWQASSDVKGSYLRQIEQTVQSAAMQEAQRRFSLQTLLPACAPLSPITALLLWPLFRSKLAQHERSLFAFLVDRGPFGFQEFLSTTPGDVRNPLFYRVDRLYDYVTTTLGAAVFLGDRAKRWAEIGHAVDRISADAPELSQVVVKTIGLLDLYGVSVGLRASEDILKLACSDSTRVAEALEYLERASIIVYRRYESAYALWEGSDVDLDASHEEALRHVGHGKLSRRLKRAVAIRPFVARAHYIKSGTLRYFDVDIIDGSKPSLEKAIRKKLSSADGRLLFVLAPDEPERESLIEYAKELTADDDPALQLHLFAFPKPMTGLDQGLEEIEAWRWIQENETALQGDPVARQEVRAHIDHAERQLMEIAGQVLGLRGYLFDPAASDWVQGGNSHGPNSAIDFQRWLSNLCDSVYDKAPALHNELINRENISSATTAARRNLLEAMIEKEEEEDLGFEGTPAEVSLYRSLLQAGGFHQRRDGKLGFGEPYEEWKPVWAAMEEFLQETRSGRRPLLELISKLKRPPFGLREGPIPLLLCALLLAKRDHVALYEGGMYVPGVRIDVLERLTRVPEDFEIQHYELTGVAQEAFAAINKVLRNLELTEETEGPNLLQIVKPLVVFAARLPSYTQKTRRIEPPEAIAVRDALLRARDPYTLMFKDLPGAIGVSIESEEAIPVFAESLRACLLGLQRAYPHLLDEIEDQLRSVFDLRGTSKEARQQLQSRAMPLDGYAIDRRLALFVSEAGRLDDRDWREVLGRVINEGIPPTHWHDAQVVDFQLRLRQLGSAFVRLEELVAEQQNTGTSRILRIGLLDGSFEEARAVVTVPPERAPAVEALAERISEILEDGADDSEDAQRVRVAALAQVVERYLRRNGREA